MIGLSRWNLQNDIVRIIHKFTVILNTQQERAKYIKIFDSLLRVDSYTTTFSNLPIFNIIFLQWNNSSLSAEIDLIVNKLEFTNDSELTSTILPYFAMLMSIQKFSLTLRQRTIRSLQFDSSNNSQSWFEILLQLQFRSVE